MKVRLLLIACIMVACIGLVMLLSIGITRPLNLQCASFNRKFCNAAIRPLDQAWLGFDSYYFAGSTDSMVFLGNHTVPGLVKIVHERLSASAEFRFEVPSAIGEATIMVDYPFVHLVNGDHPAIYTGSFGDSLSSLNFDNIYFSNVLPISRNSFALLAIPRGTRQMTIQKKCAGDSVPEVFPHLLKKQVDGIFCTEGTLHYNKARSELIYVYSYRNEYFAMDTSLNLLYRANTIDTVGHAKITLGENKEEVSMHILADNLLVNKMSAAHGKYLLINSNLLAKNEKVENFQNQTVIDVYDLSDRSYVLSFYIPPYEGVKVTSFRFLGANKLICLYGEKLVKYAVDFNFSAL